MLAQTFYSTSVRIMGVTVYKLAFGVMRAVWGRWYGSKSRQEEVCTSRLSSVGQEGTGSVRITLQEQKRRRSGRKPKRD